jgi:flagellar basal-body rod protein FlgF
MADSMKFITQATVANSQAFEILANNIANASTVGFKSDKISFKEVYSDVENKETALGVSADSSDFSQGPLKTTGNPLDVALSGDGFFVGTTHEGQKFYTRQGSLIVNKEGMLSFASGESIHGRGGAVQLNPLLPVQIDQEGRILQNNAMVDALTVVSVSDTKKLSHRGEGGWIARENVEEKPSSARVVSQSLEMSNVNPVRAMIDIVQMSRFYDSLHRVMDIFRQVEQRASNEL